MKARASSPRLNRCCPGHYATGRPPASKLLSSGRPALSVRSPSAPAIPYPALCTALSRRTVPVVSNWSIVAAQLHTGAGLGAGRVQVDAAVPGLRRAERLDIAVAPRDLAVQPARSAELCARGRRGHRRVGVEEWTAELRVLGPVPRRRADAAGGQDVPPNYCHECVSFVIVTARTAFQDSPKSPPTPCISTPPGMGTGWSLPADRGRFRRCWRRLNRLRRRCWRRLAVLLVTWAFAGGAARPSRAAAPGAHRGWSGVWLAMLSNLPSPYAANDVLAGAWATGGGSFLAGGGWGCWSRLEGQSGVAGMVDGRCYTMVHATRCRTPWLHDGCRARMWARCHHPHAHHGGVMHCAAT